MFFSREASLVRKRPSNKRSSNGGTHHRRLKIEPLENRCLLSVTLGSPSAAAWVYGQTESASAVVIDGVTNAPPPLHTEVDLVNAGAATAAPSPILAKGFTSDVSGDVTFDLSALNVGNYNLQAEFTDSAGNLEASNTQPVAVSQAATTTTLALSPTARVPCRSANRWSSRRRWKPSVRGRESSPAGSYSRTFPTATPTVLGKAQVAFNSSIATADTGVATFVDASLPVGSHSIVAFYQGNRDFMPSDNAAAPDAVIVANAATTTFVSAAPNPAVYGAVVTLSASVLPAFLPPGPTPIPLAGVAAGGAVSTAFILPTGSVQFAYTIHGSTTPTVLLGSPVPLVHGRAQSSVPSLTALIAALPVGIDDIIATYIPDAASKYQGSTSQPYSEVVIPAPATIATKTTVTPPSQTVMAGSEASFTIAVTPATGTATVPGTDKVYMYDVGAAIGAATVGTTVKTFLGLATYDSADSDWTFTTTTPLAAGFHTIEAYFAGDTTFAPSSARATVTVVPQLLTHVVVTAGPNPSVYGATVTLTATVLAGYFGPVTTLPAGSVQFAYSPHGTALMVLLGSPVPLVNGQAVLKVPSATPAIGPLPVGIDDVTATYIPASSTFTGNTSLPFSEVILPVAGTVPTTTTVTPPSQTTAAGKEAGFTISVATPAACAGIPNRPGLHVRPWLADSRPAGRYDCGQCGTRQSGHERYSWAPRVTIAPAATGPSPRRCPCLAGSTRSRRSLPATAPTLPATGLRP